MASDMEQQIRETAKKLFETEGVALVIGYEAGSTPFRTTPAFIHSADEVDRLVWTPGCTNNLSVYLPKVAKWQKVGIVAKACDVKSMVTLVQEHQIPRENVFVIAAACPAMIDDVKLTYQDIDLSDVKGVAWDGDGFAVGLSDGKRQFPKAEIQKDACSVCGDRKPAASYVTVGEIEDVTPEPAPYPESLEERREMWAKEFSRCIRCYACRQVCPMCYCETCFADRTDAKWVSKKSTPEEAWMFHIGRAMHLAGRCSECGECTRACPMELPVGKLTYMMNRKVEDLFDFTAGADMDADPVLGSFNPDDPDPVEH